MILAHFASNMLSGLWPHSRFVHNNIFLLCLIKRKGLLAPLYGKLNPDKTRVEQALEANILIKV